MMGNLQSIGGILRSFALGLVIVIVIGMASAASAMPIDKRLVVTVRTVCNDVGEDCSFQGPLGDLFYEIEGDKIWAQAGIDLEFILDRNVNSTELLHGPAGGLADFTDPLVGPGTTMYLTSSLLCAHCTLYGAAWLGAGGLVINMDAVSTFASGVGRIDTIAHELGHNLGLYAGPGAVDGHDNGNPHFLMASGEVRDIPASLSHICPDPSAAACLDFLTPAHIATARASVLLIPVPEPAAWILLLLGAAVVPGAARRHLI